MGNISSRGAKRNYIINGDMRISQRDVTFTAVANSAYTLDKYSYSKVGAMVHTVTQDTDVPTVAQSGHTFANSLKLDVTTIDAAIAATDVCLFQNRIEGYNFADLAQKPFTLSFWVKATKVGTYCVAFQNSGRDRSYVVEYTINNTLTWEYKTLNVTASPSAGTWDYASGIGLEVRWVLASGSNFHTTANTWQTTNVVATSNQVNGVDSTANDFWLTGVMLNEGTGNAPFRTFSGAGVAGELIACQRYYEKSYAQGVVPGTGSSTGIVAQGFGINVNTAARTDIQVDFEVQKRTTPSVSYWDATGNASRLTRLTATGSADNISLNGSLNPSSNNLRIRHDDTTNNRVGFSFHWAVDADL